jgi:hypothetical protein
MALYIKNMKKNPFAPSPQNAEENYYNLQNSEKKLLQDTWLVARVSTITSTVDTQPIASFFAVKPWILQNR